MYIDRWQNSENINIHFSYGNNGIIFDKGKRRKGIIQSRKLWDELLNLCRQYFEERGELADNTVGKDGEMIDVQEKEEDVILDYSNTKTNSHWALKLSYVTWYYIVMKNSYYDKKNKKSLDGAQDEDFALDFDDGGPIEAPEPVVVEVA